MSEPHEILPNQGRLSPMERQALTRPISDLSRLPAVQSIVLFGSQTREGIRRMISLHFIKPGVMPVHLARYMDNLSGRRKTAEYSRLAEWEFTEEEVRTYTQWAGACGKAFLKALEEKAPELRDQTEALMRSIDEPLQEPHA
jgi:hypothetical protein